MEITNDIAYIGVNDYDIKLFEAQYAVENGMAYNSYVITDDKIAVIDSVAAGFGEQWLSNIEKATGGKAPDYIIVQHMEPDHSANIKLFTEKYPNAAVGRFRQGVCDDEAVFRNGFFGQADNCRRKGRTFAR